MVLAVDRQACGTGHAITCVDIRFGRQFPDLTSMFSTVLPALEQSMPSEQGRQVPKVELYFSGRQTHSVEPGREVSYVGCEGSHASQSSAPDTELFLPASQTMQVVA
jgi:hypothetical protein